MITTANTEPAALDAATANMGLGPELAEELLNGHRARRQRTRRRNPGKGRRSGPFQLGLVLTQQTQRLAEAAASPTLADRKADAHAAAPTTPDISPSTAADTSTKPASPARERRRRRKPSAAL
ncbi:hypothetical protein [Mycolicibacterium sp. GESEQ-9]|uniref:hypothetical protein n=1 Tax=Mycolicibacterium sp. GESEQ-9 TaxID=2812656 RepID=UPI001B3224B0|nr:hypothetical protein [Mycolicibacterium sp. GESEQ-9]